MGQSPAMVSGRCEAPIPLARNNAFAPFFTFLDNIGAPTDRWLEQSHIPAARVSGLEGVVPLYSGYQFIELAAGLGHLDNLGVLVAQRASAFDLGAYGAALERATTVGEYLQIGCRHASTLCSWGTRFWLSTEGNQLRINQHLTGPDTLGVRVADVYTLVLTISMLRRFLGQDWRPGEIRLRYGLESLLGDWDVPHLVPVRKDQPHTSFTMPTALLARRVHTTRAPRTMPTDNGAGLAANIPMDFLSSIEQLVLTLVAAGLDDIGSVAAAAGLSQRTLQRRLTEAGASYRALVNAARCRLARRRLAGSTIRITDIASELGYSDASNFARAFQRQTGFSPMAYRRLYASP